MRVVGFGTRPTENRPGACTTGVVAAAGDAQNGWVARPHRPTPYLVVMRSFGDPRLRLPVAWHLVTAALIATCLAVQLVMTIRGIAVLVDENGRAIADLPTRLLRFFTFFTIESNIAAMLAAAGLAVRPLRDGAGWRVLRVASVVGMSVTFVVYLVALAPILSLSGVAWWTDIGFHIAAPVLTVVGWLLFRAVATLRRPFGSVVHSVAVVLDRLCVDARGGLRLVPLLPVPRCCEPRLPPCPAQLPAGRCPAARHWGRVHAGRPAARSRQPCLTSRDRQVCRRGPGKLMCARGELKPEGSHAQTGQNRRSER